MGRRNVPLGIGIDALGDDEEDGFRELRLTHLLHSGVSFDAGLSVAALWEAACRTEGARLSLPAAPDHGLLAAGRAGATGPSSTMRLSRAT